MGGHRNIKTHNAVSALRVNNPHMTLQEIADVVGLSRQRVQVILKVNGLPTKAKKEPDELYCPPLLDIDWLDKAKGDFDLGKELRVSCREQIA
jgi:hypothetical protein